MKRLSGCLLLILGLIVSVSPASAQSSTGGLEHWHTAGAGLSTPLGFNVGATYSVQVKGPVFVQAGASFTKDFYVTKHSIFSGGPSLGLRQYTDVALVSLSMGPTFNHGRRGLDLYGAGTTFESTALNIVGQVLFRELNMGFEVYSNVNPVRNVSGMRLIYRLGRIQ